MKTKSNKIGKGGDGERESGEKFACFPYTFQLNSNVENNVELDWL